MNYYRIGIGSMSGFRWMNCFVVADSIEHANAIWANVHPESSGVPYPWEGKLPKHTNGVKPEVFAAFKA